MAIIMEMTCSRFTPKTNRDIFIQNAKIGVTSLGLIASLKINSALAAQIKSNRNIPLQFQALRNSTTFLSQRAISSDSTLYEPGILYPDIYYPNIFAGKWNVSSTFKDVYAPLGVDVFGGELVYKAALKDLNSTLNYITKYKNLTDGIYNNKYYK